MEYSHPLLHYVDGLNYVVSRLSRKEENPNSSSDDDLPEENERKEVWTFITCFEGVKVRLHMLLSHAENASSLRFFFLPTR